ncbi:hypothetical protein EV672_11712 [Aquabacterium commune]|uniref:Uncharacterized protein n=1 Tax=Aquabacterium commune TaxID=70586 RepID=A0A4R6QZL4_9BURK|nr:hypothetical protein [Aquabacterium commune]TDP78734.1 hypothetical protein EV672_11712 [Aquabacterium commune]
MTDLVQRKALSGIEVRMLVQLLAAAAVLIPTTVLFGERIVVALLPLMREVFEWVGGDFKLLRLAVDREGADRVVRATVMWKHIVFIGGHVIYPDHRGTANASTLIAHVLQGPLAALLVTCAWPLTAGTGRIACKQLASRLLILSPWLLILVCADVPAVLAGELWQMALDVLAPGSKSALVYWKNFLQGGGRYALGLAGAVAAIQLTTRHS